MMKEKGERNPPFKSQRDYIHDIHVQGYQESNRSLIPNRNSNESHGTSDIHRVSKDIERESFDAMVHEDAEVIAEEGPGDSELPSGGDDKQLTKSYEYGGDDDI